MKHGKAIMIRRERGYGVLEVERVWTDEDGGRWVCTIRGRKGPAERQLRAGET